MRKRETGGSALDRALAAARDARKGTETVRVAQDVALARAREALGVDEVQQMVLQKSRELSAILDDAVTSDPRWTTRPRCVAVTEAFRTAHHCFDRLMTDGPSDVEMLREAEAALAAAKEAADGTKERQEAAIRAMKTAQAAAGAIIRAMADVQNAMVDVAKVMQGEELV